MDICWVVPKYSRVLIKEGTWGNYFSPETKPCAKTEKISYNSHKVKNRIFLPAKMGISWLLWHWVESCGGLCLRQDNNQPKTRLPDETKVVYSLGEKIKLFWSNVAVQNKTLKKIKSIIWIPIKSLQVWKEEKKHAQLITWLLHDHFSSFHTRWGTATFM